MVDKSNIDEEIVASIRKFSSLAKDEQGRQREIIELPEFIQQKAALISAHFLLPTGATVVDMACGRGEVTYMFAAMNPNIQVIGLDRNMAAIEFARKTYELPNLSYRVGDVRMEDFEDTSIDGIINSNILYQVYSENDRDPSEVTNVIEAQISKLKPGGLFLVRDYMMPTDEYVFLELPDVESKGTHIAELSDADLLVHYSQTARPLGNGCEGFFLEELPPARENTRLFRLLHKWALEFIHRKDSRNKWATEVHQEFTFFTYQDYRREFSKMGMRMIYSAPYWNPWVVSNCFKGRFQLYREDGTPMSSPATNHFVLSQRVGSETSLTVEERRPAQRKVEKLSISTVRDKETGQVHEFAKRPDEYCDIVPYRFTRDGRLMIYVQSGFPRPVVNAVSRGAHNLDGKRWSGHLIEPIMMDTSDMTDDVDANKSQILEFVGGHLKLKARINDSFVVGPSYYPSPDQLDMVIEPVFVEVHKPEKTSWRIEDVTQSGFTNNGRVLELEADEIIRAAQVGLLPDPRLELHIFDLMMRFDIKPPPYIGEQLPETQGAPETIKDAEQILEAVKPGEFAPERQGHTHLKPVRSIFVEDGKFGGAVRGMNSQDAEFIVTEDGVENIAVILPMTRDWDNNVLVALEPKSLPVPQRMGGSGNMLTLPSFVLPKDIHTVEEAKQFVAKKFNLPVERVGQLGESYYTQTDMMPQRVYPFCIATEGQSYGPDWHYTTMRRLWILLYCFECFSADTLRAIAHTYMALDHDHGMAPVRQNDVKKRKDFKLTVDKVDLDIAGKYDHRPASRILGERGVPKGVDIQVDLMKKSDLQKMEVEYEMSNEDKMKLSHEIKTAREQKSPENKIKKSGVLGEFAQEKMTFQPEPSAPEPEPEPEKPQYDQRDADRKLAAPAPGIRPDNRGGDLF